VRKGIFRRWMKNEVGEVDEGETRREEKRRRDG
jgi:hypothetical protein